MTPRQNMPPQVWNKPYWNYTKQDWLNWINAFKTLPAKEYNDHIGSCIDLYLGDEQTITEMIRRIK